MWLRVSLVIAVIVGTFTLAGAAQGAVILSPPLFMAGTNEVECNIVNISDVDRDVTVEVWSAQGFPLASCFTGPLAAGHGFACRGSVVPSMRYCRFVVEGAKANFRAAVCLFQPGVGSIACVEAN